MPGGRPKGSKNAVHDPLGSWEVKRVMERAVTSRAREVAEKVVDGAVGIYQEAMEVLRRDMHDPETSPNVRSTNARFLVDFSAKILGMAGNSEEAAKAIGAPLTITMEEVRGRIESDPAFARSLACGDEPGSGSIPS